MTNEEIKIYYENIADWSDDQEERFNQTYDGLVGMVKEWFPDNDKREFLSKRENLFTIAEVHNYHIDDMRRWLDGCYEFNLGNGPENVPPMPDGCFAIVNTLSYYKYIDSLGVIDGLKQLAGDYAVAGMKSHEGREKAKVSKKEKAEELKRVVQFRLSAIQREHPEWYITACREQAASDLKISLSTVYKYSK